MEEATTGLSFQELGIANALNQYSLVVPLNQRSYAWTDKHVETLLSDLTKAFDDDVPIYFLGMIVLTRSRSQLEVADGQQRLATVSIIISAVRDYLVELAESKAANAYQESYLLKYEPKARDYRAKLTLNYEDNDYFLKTILKPPYDREPYEGRSFTSHDRLAEAYEIVKRHIRNLTASYFNDEDKASRLYEWMDFLNNTARVIVIMVSGNVGNVFTMFETLNARGLRASQTDILKNYLFDRGKDRLGDIHPAWTSMVGVIDSIAEDREDDLLISFIRHYWIAHHGPTTERELGRKIEQAVKSERQAVDTVKALDSFSYDYVSLLTPRESVQSEFNSQARDCLYTMTRELRVSQILPLLLSISRYFKTREAEKAFKVCLSWCVRFLICGGGGGGVLDKQYGLKAKEVSSGIITTAKELSDKMASVVPGDEAFKTAFANVNVRLSHLARYYLRAIDLFLKQERNPQLIPSEDTRAVNIEHVLPINPSPEWRITPEEAVNYYKRLGNLALLSAKENVKLGNKDFEQKKKIFSRSPFLTTSGIAIYAYWGPRAIAERQSELSKLAPKVWPLL